MNRKCKKLMKNKTDKEKIGKKIQEITGEEEEMVMGGGRLVHTAV